MKILITGANGFLGHYLCSQLLKKGHTVMATGKGDCRLPFSGLDGFHYQPLDFTDPFEVHDLFASFQPQVVIHAGAMTQVDQCEKEQWQAYLVNVEGTVTLLMNAEEYKSFFLFVSTDFVFDGVKGDYEEDDEPAPVNFYGRTKLEAEDAVKEYEFDWAIVRTSLVYGQPAASRSNILTVVKEKLSKKEAYNVVDDQLRTPTFVEDLAAAIILIVEQKATGIYHISGNDKLTPYNMACHVADHLHLDKTLLKKVTEKDFSQPARRPLRTTFNINKAVQQLGYTPTPFMVGLQKTFDSPSL